MNQKPDAIILARDYPHEDRARLLEMLIEGRSNNEILTVMDREGRQTPSIGFIRALRADPEVLDAIHRRETEAMQTGYARRDTRMQALQKVADATMRRLFPPGAEYGNQDLSAKEWGSLVASLTSVFSKIEAMAGNLRSPALTPLIAPASQPQEEAADIAKTILLQALKNINPAAHDHVRQILTPIEGEPAKEEPKDGEAD